jgi:hypothetical protein
MLTSCKGINRYVKYTSCWFFLAYEKACMLLYVLGASFLAMVQQYAYIDLKRMIMII